MQIFSMSSVQEMQRVDRELIKSLVNPAFLHMSTPLKGYDPMFYLLCSRYAVFFLNNQENSAEYITTRV